MQIAWEMVYPIGIAALLAVLAYGVWRYHTRNKANDAVTERATHELYADPEAYPEKREALERQVEPD